jgi:hypothetical protein
MYANQFNRCTLSHQSQRIGCHTVCVPNGGPLIKLPNVTFTINEPPMRHLLWCNKVPRGKRTKCAKINGVTHQETTNK